MPSELDEYISYSYLLVCFD